MWLPDEVLIKDCTLNLNKTVFCSFLTILSSLYRENNNDYNYKSMKNEFDIIIVGAGSAGCVLANRLSEISSLSILLIEAGSDEPSVTEIPGLSPFLWRSNIDWIYRSQPEAKACGWRGGQCQLSLGKGMGGSSSINMMKYTRGNRHDYNEWAQLGNLGWDYERVLPYFKKSENNTKMKNNLTFHGIHGYLTVENNLYSDKNIDIVFQAFKEMGYKTEFDINEEEMLGVTKLQTTSKNGIRQSTNTAFIKPIKFRRANLEIRQKARVTKIIINKETKEATGVTYVDANGIIQIISANKQVILSAGVFNSPKILMLSGIGPKKHLKEHGIEIIRDLAVGKNLQDHVKMNALYFSLPETMSTEKTLQDKIADLRNFRETQKGPFASIGLDTVCAYVQTKYEETIGIPDIKFVLSGTMVNDLLNCSTTLEIPQLARTYYNTLSLNVNILKPKSRGSLQLNCTDPIWGEPEIRFNYFENKRDEEVMIEGIRKASGIVNTETIKKHGLVLRQRESCQEHKYNSDIFWKCMIKKYADSGYHYVGTCKMGPKEDPEAVVDPRLRVYGVKRLRVVDASVMPIIPRANTNAPTIMIAEKASDLIKEEWLPHS